MDDTEYEKLFGFNPKDIGNRYRGHWIIVQPDEDDEAGNAKEGYLCVKTRDGASNAICTESLQKPNCVGTVEDGYDCTYRYYYFRPLEAKP